MCKPLWHKPLVGIGHSCNIHSPIKAWLGKSCLSSAPAGILWTKLDVLASQFPEVRDRCNR